MSLPPDPDEPRRRLPPTHPSDVPPSAGYEREVAAAPEEELYWREALLDRLRSLRTAVVLLGIVAVAAVGVALWALLSADREGGGGRGRLDELEQQQDGAP